PRSAWHAPGVVRDSTMAARLRMGREYTPMSLVRLRPLSLDDVDRMMDWANDPDIVGNIAAFAGKPLARDDEEAYVRRRLASDANKGVAIERAADGASPGNVGVHQIF